MSFLSSLGFAILLGPIAGSMYAGYQQQKLATKNAKLQRRQQDLQQAREKRQLVRQARIVSATAQNNAENQGVAGSSANLGGVGSIQSQLASNMSFLDQYKALSDKMFFNSKEAATYQTAQGIFDTVTNLAMSAAGNPAAFNSLFRRGP